MSKSYHTTMKDLRGKTKQEIDKMVDDPDSILNELVKKSRAKEEVINQRKITEYLEQCNVEAIKK